MLVQAVLVSEVCVIDHTEQSVWAGHAQHARDTVTDYGGPFTSWPCLTACMTMKAGTGVMPHTELILKK